MKRGDIYRWDTASALLRKMLREGDEEQKEAARSLLVWWGAWSGIVHHEGTNGNIDWEDTIKALEREFKADYRLFSLRHTEQVFIQHMPDNEIITLFNDYIDRTPVDMADGILPRLRSISIDGDVHFRQEDLVICDDDQAGAFVAALGCCVADPLNICVRLSDRPLFALPLYWAVVKSCASVTIHGMIENWFMIFESISKSTNRLRLILDHTGKSFGSFTGVLG